MALDRFVRPQMNALRATVEEAWKPDHNAAMRCFDVEQLVRTTVSVCDLIEFFDLRWRLQLARGEANVPVGAEILATVDELLDEWIDATAHVEERISSCEGDGFSVEGAKDFRSRRARIMSALADRD